MKSYFTLILFSFLSTCMLSQNWEILNTNKTYFYRHSDSLHIGNTIHIDSIVSNETNESFFTTYKYKECDTCTVYPDGLNENNTTLIYRYAPEFLGFEIVLENENNLYSLDNKIVKHHSVVGEIWDFSSSVQATTISVGQQELFGEMDSLKTIVLSSNDTIILSQNKGLVRYPDFENEGKYYELGGYHEGQNSYGEYAPNFWSTYDFEIGDRFCYYRSPAQQGSDPVFQDFHCQFDILNKYVEVDTMFLTILKKCVRHTDTPDDFFGPYYTNGQYSINLLLDDSRPESRFGVTPVANNSGIPSISLDGYPFLNYVEDYYPFDYYATWIEYSEQLGMMKRINRYSLFGDSLLYADHPYGYSENAYFSILDNNLESDQMIYANNVGLVGMGVYYGFGGFVYHELSGFKSNGDTLGDYCDFPVNLGIETHSLLPLSIHPNPTTSQITIEGYFETLEIYSQTGQLVMQIVEPKNVIDVSKLPSGIYFVKALLEEKLYATKLIIE